MLFTMNFPYLFSLFPNSNSKIQPCYLADSKTVVEKKLIAVSSLESSFGYCYSNFDK